MAKPGSCPRCGDSNTEKVADSPVKGAWEVFGCNHCNYLWRSTEKINIPKIPPKKLQEAVWLWNDKGQANLRTRDQL
jgi:hypothetical protein